MNIIKNAVEIKRPESAVTKEEKEYFMPAKIKPSLKIERLIYLFEKIKVVNVMQFKDDYFNIYNDFDFEYDLRPPENKLVHKTIFIVDCLLPAVRNENEFRHHFWQWMRDNNRHIFIEECLKNSKDKSFIKFDVDLKYNVNGMVAEWMDEDGEHKASFAAGPIPARLLLADEMQFCKEVLDNAK